MTDVLTWLLAIGLLVLVWRWRAVNVTPERDNPDPELDDRYAARRRHPSTGTRPCRHVRRIDRPALYDWDAE